MSKCEVATLGGGRGHSVLVEGLTYQMSSEYITSILGMRDSGGDTRFWIDNFDSPALGDFKKVMASLAPVYQREYVRELLNVRLLADGNNTEAAKLLKGRNVGNILLYWALENKGGNLQDAIDFTMRGFGIKGRILPLDLDKADLVYRTKNGKQFTGEDVIDNIHEHPEFDPTDPFVHYDLDKPAEINPEVANVLLNVSRIALAPGSLETSIIPIFLTRGVREVLRESRAIKTMVINLVTEPFASPYQTVTQFMDKIIDTAGEGIFNHAVVNTTHPPEAAGTQYAKRGQKFTELDYDKKSLEYRGIKIHESELLVFPEIPDYSFRVLQQDPEKLGRAVYNTFEPVRSGKIDFLPVLR